MALVKICNRIIEYSFYAIFLIIPWALWKDTSELFELNKMWLTWGLTIIIGAAWLIKMVLQRRILLCRTPLDIPIALFLASQIISTIFSLDFHVSLWGYYSRFNGGLLSTISYILLYYAFLSNFDYQKLSAVVRRLLAISLISGLIVALWGLPSHFGYDPTCLLFRGTFDASCWTADFMPTVRIFSTLGQPDWLAAYLAILLPISIIMFIKFIENRPLSILYLLLSALFYVDLLYTRARSGILGVWISLIFFAAIYYWMERKRPKLSTFNFQLSTLIGIFLIITFVIGTPISQLNRFTLEGIGSFFQKVQVQKNPPLPAQPHEPGGTESADIRLNVWTGAINAWKSNPLFGTGVETFAFAYYKYKPVGHNSTSEWNFLYNKAHNEYLNFLATTGIVGLGTYVMMIGFFLTIVILRLKAEGSQILRFVLHQTVRDFAQNDKADKTLILALLSAYISILVTNFFGFSVVITNIYLFMIPAFVFALTAGTESGIKNHESGNAKISLYHWTGIFFAFVTCFWLIVNLFRFWQADIAYALGYNLDRAGEYQQAYPNLQKAVQLRGDEPVFKDELSINNAIIAAGLLAQQPSKDQEKQTIAVASTLAQEAINTSNEVISQYSNNAVFWKTRTRVFHTLSQVDSRYLPRALDAIEKASLLAPADANIFYNLGVLYGQSNNIKKGIEALEKTIQFKPDYRDARYALGLFYHTASLDPKGKVVIDSALHKKAIDQMQYILDHLNPNDAGALESIKSWVK